MPPGSKKKPDPLAPFKRAVALATRSLAANKSMNVVFSSDAPGYDGKTVRLPQPSRAMSRKEVAIIRGHADAIALMISLHDAKVHASLTPPSGAAKSAFELRGTRQGRGCRSASHAWRGEEPFGQAREPL